MKQMIRYVPGTAYVTLFLVMVGVAVFLSQQYHWQRDLTRNGHHTLSQASHTVLSQLPGTLDVTAYATLQDARHGDLRGPIRTFVARYQRIKPDLELNFVDPEHDTELARAAGVQVNGEMVLSYRGRSEHLDTLNEQDFTNALMRLARPRARIVMSLTGHGERKRDGGAPHDLGEFGRQLARKGFRVEPLNLAVLGEVPAHGDVLLLSPPRTSIPQPEIDRIARYLARGGNLLWLMEPGSLGSLGTVAEALNLNLSSGRVVDPAARENNYPLAAALATRYGVHPVTAGFDLLTVFPETRAVAVNDASGWHVTSLVEVAEHGWLENDAAGENATFDASRDLPGPLTAVLALERESEDGQQRVVVAGSTAFLSNAFVGNGGNLDLGVNLVNWLTGDDGLISLQPRNTVDATLTLGPQGAVLLTLGFLVVLPLTFFGVAFFIWRRRHA